MFRRLKSLAPFESKATWAKSYRDCAVYAANQNLAATGLIPIGSFVEVGLWFPEIGDWRKGEILRELADEKITTSPKVYLAIGNDSANAFNVLPNAPEDWHTLLTDRIVFRDYASFQGDPERRAQAIFAWVDQECAKLKAYLGR